MNTLLDYLNLPYTIILRRDADGDHVARIDELPGCSAHGKTAEEALQSLEEAKELWIADCLESGQEVPKPSAGDELPSGKWVQRVPRSLHKKLADLARRERVSLNQLVTSALAESVGHKKHLLMVERKVGVECDRNVDLMWHKYLINHWSGFGVTMKGGPQIRTHYLSVFRSLYSKGSHSPRRTKVRHAEEAYKVQ